MEPGNLWTYIRDGNEGKFLNPPELPARPAYNSGTTGSKPVTLRVNQYRVQQWPQKPLYQFDVKIGDGDEPRSLLKVIWESAPVQKFLQGHAKGWLWDGNRIAWCDKPPRSNREKVIPVDLDVVRGRPPRNDRRGASNVKMFVIKCTNEVPMSAISSYLNGSMPFDNSLLQAINLMDHCMRQFPSEKHLQIKRSFFPQDSDRKALNEFAVTVEAQKGVYASVRLCEAPQFNKNSTGLAVNVDVANGVFWVPQLLHQAARNMLSATNKNLQFHDFQRQLMPRPGRTTPSGTQLFEQTNEFKDLRKLHRLKFTVKHRGKEQSPATYSIDHFAFNQHYGKEGGNAKEVTFEKKDKDNPDAPPVTTSVFDYFQRTFDITIQHWKLPLVASKKGGVFPMELCTILPNQRYMFKLDPQQTADMIKFAVTRPNVRMAAIEKGVKLLGWNEDPYLNHYGIKVENKPTVTNAKLLQPPDIQFGLGGKNKVIKPGTSGAWILKDAQLHKLPPKPLQNWHVFFLDGARARCGWPQFIKTFKEMYYKMGHPRSPEIPDPREWEVSINTLDGAMDKLMQLFKNPEKMHMWPDIVLFVVRDSNSWHYHRIKKQMDTKYAVRTQVLQGQQVAKNNDKYACNVLMKVNAKLGGTTSRAIKGGRPATVASMSGGKKVEAYPQPSYMPVNLAKKELVMIVGADVSHPAASSNQPSFAAVTMSMDHDACRYTACTEVNGFNVEIIQQPVWYSKVKTMALHWMRTVGTIDGVAYVPHQIYYIRDGVSEGQYMHVLEQEVRCFQNMLVERVNPRFAQTKITVIVASKRHHLRFLPDVTDRCRDRDGNPLPGTLAEHDITHPFQYDFYLCAHKAIQGTARPVHYHVLRDDMAHKPETLQDMLYAHSYQYMRSTTPVSIHPAVYYAHLASRRGTAHENEQIAAGPRGGAEAVQFNTNAQYYADQREATRAKELDGRVRDIYGAAEQPGEALVKNTPMGEFWLQAPDVKPYKQAIMDFKYGMWFI